MLFTHPKFALFLIIVFGLYWFASKRSFRLQNVLLLIASYVFYSFWDWRFTFLLLFSTVLDFYTGLKIYNSNEQRHKKAWLAVSICINLGVLVFFKYCNFFLHSFNQSMHLLGYKSDVALLNIILPVGISFYTFHGLSYVLDVYYNKRPPTNNFIQYALFVSFFPLLVAGPIERATHLLPQIEKPRQFNYYKAVDGLRQMLWGFFKKLVIADNCAVYANNIFDNSHYFYGITLVLGAVMFSFQIYCDFSGYADIALGTARLLGFDVVKNFSFPYFSRSVAEFWRRWNISLSTWFRDYLYIPLGGSRVNLGRKITNVFIVFLLSGLWHGANFTFIAWGCLNAFFILPSIIFKTNRHHLDTVAQDKLLPSLKEVAQIVATFTLVTFSWIFFRAPSFDEAIFFIQRIFVKGPVVMPADNRLVLIVLLPLFIFIEWFGRRQNYAIEKFGLQWPRVVRWCFYSFIVFCIGMYKETHITPFIYFQF